jgi:hypothetical protein
MPGAASCAPVNRAAISASYETPDREPTLRADPRGFVVQSRRAERTEHEHGRKTQLYCPALDGTEQHSLSGSGFPKLCNRRGSNLSDSNVRFVAKERGALGAALVDRRDFPHGDWNYPAERSQGGPHMVPSSGKDEIGADVGCHYLHLHRRHRILQSSLNPPT